MKKMVQCVFSFQFLNGAIGVKQFDRQMLLLRLFQFLNGAIGVGIYTGQQDKFILFQFLNGAIGVPNAQTICHFTPISIPKWCDWSNYF